jgi:hypothetical protein
LSLKLVDKAHCLKIKSEKWDKPGCWNWGIQFQNEDDEDDEDDDSEVVY